MTNHNDTAAAATTSASPRPQSGDIVTLENLTFVPQNDFIPEPLFDLTATTSNSSDTPSTTTTTIVLDGGHYLPGLHEILRTQCSLHTTISNVSIDAGYGHYRPDLVFHVPITKLLQSQKAQQSQSLQYTVGTSIRLQPGDIPVLVKDVLDDGNIIVLDANAPLAGSSYLCSFKLISIHRMKNPTVVVAPPRTSSTTSITSTIQRSIVIPKNHDNNNNNHINGDVDDVDLDHDDRFQIATFALGCFWGAELAYMRTHGVVGTRVGYTNGTTGTTAIIGTKTTTHSTNDGICKDSDEMKPRCEAVQIIYDTTVVSYSTLIDIAMDRIRTTNSNTGYDLHKLFQLDDDEYESKQYRLGIYFHTKEQHDVIQRLLQPLDITNNHCLPNDTSSLLQQYPIEISPATTFWEAEELHQQYLYKGGQSARKGATEPIRCYG